MFGAYIRNNVLKTMDMEVPVLSLTIDRHFLGMESVAGK